jgi:hypothetical protein
LVEVVEQYSKHSLHKMDQLVTLEKALERNRAEKKPKPRTSERPKQRYHLPDRYSPETLAEIVSRYAAGEPSTQLAGIRHRQILPINAARKKRHPVP